MLAVMDGSEGSDDSVNSAVAAAYQSFRHRAPHVLLGVTGSIAAFKACQLASDLTKSGCRVRVIMTAAARLWAHTDTKT